MSGLAISVCARGLGEALCRNQRVERHDDDGFPRVAVKHPESGHEPWRITEASLQNGIERRLLLRFQGEVSAHRDDSGVGGVRHAQILPRMVTRARADRQIWRGRPLPIRSSVRRPIAGSVRPGPRGALSFCAPTGQVTWSGLPGLLLVLGLRTIGGRGERVAVGDGHVLVHRSRGFDAPVGGASRTRCVTRWRVTTRSCARRSRLAAGHVVKTTGDGFHAVFATAPDAVDAAVDAQLGAWRPSRGRDGSVACAHGGAHGRGGGPRRRLLRHRVEPGGAVDVGGSRRPGVGVLATERARARHRRQLHDLGEHRLRDLASPNAIYQVVHPALQTEFAALRSFDAFSTNLPSQLTSFVGREREISELCDVLTSSRLVTLTGVGGVGKTRLAQQVAAEVLPRFGDGAWLVQLGPVADPDVIAETIASTLGIPNPGGVPAETVIIEDLRRRTLLLVLDNCEHVLDRVAATRDRNQPTLSRRRRPRDEPGRSRAVR